MEKVIDVKNTKNAKRKIILPIAPPSNKERVTHGYPGFQLF